MAASRGAIFTASGALLHYVQFPRGLGWHVTPKRELRRTLNRIVSTLANSVAGLQKDAVIQKSTIAIGMCGLTFPEDAEALSSLISGSSMQDLQIKATRLECYSDLDIVGAARSTRQTFAVLTCQNGSACLVKGPNERFRLGGWGPMIGDQGSAFWAGKQVIQAIAELADKGEPQCKLWKAVRSWLNHPAPRHPDWTALSTMYRMVSISKVEDDRIHLFRLIHKVRRDFNVERYRNIVSGFTIPLMNAADQECPVAEVIRDTVCDQLILLLQTAIERAQSKHCLNPEEVILSGGVFKHRLSFAKIVSETIRRKFNIYVSLPLELPSFPTSNLAGALRLVAPELRIEDVSVPQMEGLAQPGEPSPHYK